MVMNALYPRWMVAQLEGRLIHALRKNNECLGAYRHYTTLPMTSYADSKTSIRGLYQQPLCLAKIASRFFSIKIKDFRPKRIIYCNELIFRRMKWEVLCDIVTKFLPSRFFSTVMKYCLFVISNIWERVVFLKMKFNIMNINDWPNCI